MASSILTPFQKKVFDVFSHFSGNFSNFYLTGGTALSDFYLHHRYSEDFDFFCESEFSAVSVKTYIRKLREHIPEISGVEYRLVFELHTCLLTHPDGILKVDFNYYPFPRIERGKKYGKLSIDSLLDIAVNKMQTIATKPRSRDFIDLYLIHKTQGWSMDYLVKKARIKFDWYVDPLHLASRYLLAGQLKDYPRMLIDLQEKEWQEFFLAEAQKLKPAILQ